MPRAAEVVAVGPRPEVVAVVGLRRVAEEVGHRRGAAAVATSRSAPHREAGNAHGSVRSAVPAAFQDAGAVASPGRVAGCPYPADQAVRVVAAAASSPARFCLISGMNWVNAATNQQVIRPETRRQ